MSVEIEKRGDVAILWIDNPPVNALSHAVRSGLVSCLDKAESSGAKAIVIAGRGGTFIAGADIREFGQPPREPHLNAVVNRMEAMEIPVIAAVEGNTLGGGLEVALGAHFRVASPRARLGLPEVSLGILPGAGGTQRLPRLVELKEAIAMISSGRPIGSDKALEIGLVDQMADGDTVDAAVALGQAQNGPPVEERRLSRRRLDHTDDVKAAFRRAYDEIRKRARGAIAPVVATECIEAAFKTDFPEGSGIEREGFLKLVASDQSVALRHAFFSERAAAKPPKDVTGSPREVKSVGIVGAGTMGGGIAMTFAEAGLPVTIVEMNQEALDRGIGVMEKNWRRGIKSGRTTAEQVGQRMALLTPTTRHDDLKDADLIIEAVFETMDIKKDVFGKLDAVAKPGAVIATNTSYLDVDEIAAITNRPRDVLGMHYFSPANIMTLLEIVRAEKTADDALLTALAMARKTRKNAVMAGVCHGFIGNRMLSPYMHQAGALLLEGASPEQVDDALTDFGWAMGVFAVGDLAGLDVGYKSRKDQDLPPHVQRVTMIADRLVEAGFMGQKSGAGYYTHDPDTRARSNNPGADDIIESVRKELGMNGRAIDDEEIIERTQFALANEGAHILGEGHAQRASDLDVAYVHGYGYARWRGGPMHHADRVGLGKIAEKVREYADGDGGAFWEPAPLLLELAEKGMTFAEWDKQNG